MNSIKTVIENLVPRLLAVPLILVLIIWSGAAVTPLNSHTLFSHASFDERTLTSPLPLLTPFPKVGEGMQGDQKFNPTTDTGSITVKKVKVGTTELLGNATLMFTPNPYTLKKSLSVTDNSMVDSDPTGGSFQLNKVGFGSYVINETITPEGYGPILLKTRVTVHPTNQNPQVQIENRDINVPFEGTAIVTPPSLN